MGLKGRLRRIERDSAPFRWELKCPECGREVTLFGDVPMGLMVLDWEAHQPEGVRSCADEKLLELFQHEHDPQNFIEKRSGLPLSDPAVSGMRQMTCSAE